MYVSKVNDIKKQELIIKNAEAINYILRAYALCFLGLPNHLQKEIIFENFDLSLKNADHFTLREIKQIVASIKEYTRYTKRETLNRNLTID